MFTSVPYKNEGKKNENCLIPVSIINISVEKGEHIREQGLTQKLD